MLRSEELNEPISDPPAVQLIAAGTVYGLIIKHRKSARFDRIRFCITGRYIKESEFIVLSLLGCSSQVSLHHLRLKIFSASVQRLFWLQTSSAEVVIRSYRHNLSVRFEPATAHGSTLKCSHPADAPGSWPNDLTGVKPKKYLPSVLFRLLWALIFKP